jgi:catalase-peroxidase
MEEVPQCEHFFEGRDRQTGKLKWTATRSTWSSVRTRSSARSRRSTPAPTGKQKFVNDFVAAWNKVMNLDRFDLTM